MNKITNHLCTACGTCVSSCPVSCIKMKQGEDGFYTPIIQEEQCIRCNACRKICPANERPLGADWKKGTYFAVWDKDKKKRKTGSSGGAFGLLAEYILAQGGVVFGAAYKPDCKHVYQTSTEEVSLDALKKSKYVESYTGDIYKKVKSALQTGKPVLYCGTSCQADGLRKYLQKNYENLLICDFLCHGVPSVALYETYVSNLENRYGKILSIDFRSKSFGWKAYCVKATFESGKRYLKTRFQDPYLRLFFESDILRDSCKECNRLHTSTADITLADFWRVAEYGKIKDTNEGISLVGVHTETGKKVAKAVFDSENVFCEKLPMGSYQYAYKEKQHKKNVAQDNNERNVENLFDISVGTTIRLKGLLYAARAWMQKMKTGK